ncbi:hypothetical protein GEA64_01200 [Photorhabdus khanii]|uniref:Uncharacterized protein n=3 Tax=Photorhabdus TaxID=29487 RepID=A0A081RUT8_PHOTE|nr:hypothetical protein B738_11885 [Photorhabdus temperata subsp. temperata M1021]ERT11087.1 hypothetical protein O185_21340 [Photorhabdus temperata J3]KER02441.1 hypothetical protein MEG1DRAFT_02895 [Photorhabdus temperata subsp. temperata Meg1]MQL46687.1 hypothetical protein [Photorhabdus khanii]
MDLEKLRKLTLSSGFTFKELLMMQRTFKNLDDDERRYVIKYYTKNDNIYNVIIVLAEDAGDPVLFFTLMYAGCIIMEIFLYDENSISYLSLVSILYIISTIICICYKSFYHRYRYNLFTCIKLVIFYIRFRIKEHLKQL